MASFAEKTFSPHNQHNNYKVKDKRGLSCMFTCSCIFCVTLCWPKKRWHAAAARGLQCVGGSESLTRSSKAGIFHPLLGGSGPGQYIRHLRNRYHYAFTWPGHASSMSTITSSPESKRASSFPLGLCWTSVSARKSIKFPTHVLICAKKAIKIPLLCEIKSAMGEKTVELKRCFWPRGKRSTTVFTICQHVVWCAREAWHLVFHSGCTAVLYNFTHSDN